MANKQLSFVPSSKGKDVADVDQFMYTFQRESLNAKYFRCTNWRRKCPARLIVYSDGKFTEKNSHSNHLPNREKVEAYKLRHNAKQYACENPSAQMNDIISK